MVLLRLVNWVLAAQCLVIGVLILMSPERGDTSVALSGLLLVAGGLGWFVVDARMHRRRRERIAQLVSSLP